MLTDFEELKLYIVGGKPHLDRPEVGLWKEYKFQQYPLVAQELSSMHVASQGRMVPAWFAEGVGRVIASRVATGGDSRVDRWDDALPTVIGRMTAPDDFLTGKLAPEEADIAAYSFCKFLKDSNRYPALLAGLKDKKEFDQAFKDAFGGDPKQVAGPWAAKLASSVKK